MAWALSVLLMTGNALASGASLPSPPDQPQWEAPNPLDIRSTLLVDGADSAPGLNPVTGRVNWRRLAEGKIEVDVWLVHNGSERVDVARTQAWSQGGRLLVAYRYRDPEFPHEPVCACLGYTRIATVVQGFAGDPIEVVVHEGRLEFSRSDAPSGDGR